MNANIAEKIADDLFLKPRIYFDSPINDDELTNSDEQYLAPMQSKIADTDADCDYGEYRKCLSEATATYNTCDNDCDKNNQENTEYEACHKECGETLKEKQDSCYDDYCNKN